MLTPRDRLIVALDVSSAAAARKIVAAVGESVSTFKVGMQLYTAEGPSLVRELVDAGRKVFLDLKYHDIPNTVAGAASAATRLGVSIFNVHASGGKPMMEAAANAATETATRERIARPIVLGVTVLTEGEFEKLIGR